MFSLLFWKQYFNCSLLVRLQLLNFKWISWITVSHNRLIASNFDRATNPHPNPTDFAHEIRIWRMRILAGSVTSLEVTTLFPTTMILPPLYCVVIKQCYQAAAVHTDVGCVADPPTQHHSALLYYQICKAPYTNLQRLWIRSQSGSIKTATSIKKKVWGIIGLVNDLHAFVIPIN